MHMFPNSRAMATPYYSGLAALSLGDTTNAAIGAGAAGANLGLMIAAEASAIPVAGAIIAAGVAITALVETLIANSGCGQTCVVSSNFANKIGTALTDNLNAYLGSPRTEADQAQALANFDYLQNELVQYCSNPQLGDAGKRCIEDRQRGACHWRSSPGFWTVRDNGTSFWTPPGPSGSGDACFNNFIGLRDPIANDPGVKYAPSAGTLNLTDAGSFVSDAASSLGVSATTLLLGIGLILVLSLPSSSSPRRYRA